jgi:hypothetical protein
MTHEEEVYQFFIKKDPRFAQAKREDVLRFAYTKEPRFKEQSFLKNMANQFMAGFGQQSTPSDTLPEKAAYFVGENVAPTVGAVMGAPGGIPGMMAGAAAGRAVQKGVAQGANVAMPGMAAKETPGQVISDVGIQAAAEGAAGVGGKLLTAGLRGLKPIAKEVLHGTTNVPYFNMSAAIDDPNILFRAKDMGVMKQELPKFFESQGLVYGQDALKAATGKLKLSDNAADDFSLKVIQRVDDLTGLNENGVPFTDFLQPNALRELNQQVLAARYGLKDAIGRAEKAGNETLKERFTNSKALLDAWLMHQVPGAKKTLTDYSEAKTKQAFNSVWPLRTNSKRPDWGRVLTSMGVAGGAVMKGMPLGTLAPVAASPKAVGIGIRGLAGAKYMFETAAKTNLPSSAVRPMIAHFMQNATEQERAALVELMKKHGFGVDPDEVQNDPLGIRQPKRAGAAGYLQNERLLDD